MRLDRLTSKTRQALVASEQRATKAGHPELYPEHLLTELLQQAGGITTPIVQKAGARVEPIGAELERRLAAMPKVSGGAQPTISRRLRALMTDAWTETERPQGRVHVRGAHPPRAGAPRARTSSSEALRRAPASPPPR